MKALEEVEILDFGNVILWRVDGTDLDVENAARTTFFKQVDTVTPGYIERLARNKHMSPFRHVGLWFEFRFPGDVKGQFLKHLIGVSNVEDGTAWNEESFRGEKKEFNFHRPAPRMPVGKWGQGELFDADTCTEFNADLDKFYSLGQELYNKWIQRGVAAENTRKFIPFYGTYTHVRSRMSLEAAFHFWELRQDPHAQLEIREYATAVDTITSKYFPISWRALRNARVLPTGP